MRLSESLKQLGHPVAYYPVLARVFGMEESVFIAQLVYWTGKQDNPEGWIYKTSEDMQEETGLSYEQQLRVRRVLGGVKTESVRSKRMKQAYFETIVESRWDPNQHLMWYRVDFEALDRAFSNSLFGELEEGGIPCNPRTPYRVMTKSSIHRLQRTETTSSSALKKAHKDFVNFWQKMTKEIHGKSPKWTKADFKNLKTALTSSSVERLEQLALYFLADPMFKGYGIQLHTFLSAGVMKALRNEQNKEGFWKYVDIYACQYYKPVISPDEVDVPEMDQVISDLVAKLTLKK